MVCLLHVSVRRRLKNLLNLLKDVCTSLKDFFLRLVNIFLMLVQGFLFESQIMTTITTTTADGFRDTEFVGVFLNITLTV